MADTKKQLMPIKNYITRHDKLWGSSIYSARRILIHRHRDAIMEIENNSTILETINAVSKLSSIRVINEMSAASGRVNQFIEMEAANIKAIMDADQMIMVFNQFFWKNHKIFFRAVPIAQMQKCAHSWIEFIQLEKTHRVSLNRLSASICHEYGFDKTVFIMIQGADQKAVKSAAMALNRLIKKCI